MVESNQMNPKSWWNDLVEGKHLNRMITFVEMKRIHFKISLINTKLGPETRYR